MQTGIQYYVPKAFNIVVSGIQDCSSVSQLQQLAKLIFVHPCIISIRNERIHAPFWDEEK
jgi:hypothetical protein